jgi:molybdenum cofactor cytidylyltransferase
MTDMALVLLAAGGSTRMGEPKQLLEFQGKKLIQIVVERLLACRCFPTVVVLGAGAQEIAPFLAGYELNVIQNLNWQSGMASSIRCAVEFVETMFPDVGQMMLALVDQPYVEAEDYYALVEAAEAEPQKVVAAYYGGQAGAPMVFPRAYFPALGRLAGDQGARGIVRGLGPEAIKVVPLPQAAADWDVPEDRGKDQGARGKG